MKTATTCQLCQTPLGSHSVTDATTDQPFCCHGCLSVYRILSAQGNLENFTDQPVFREAVRAGIISNPTLLEKLQDPSDSLEGLQRLHLDIGGMWCPSCAMLIRLLLSRQPGVAASAVDYATDLATIDYHPEKVGTDTLIALIARAGYEPKRLEEAGQRGVSRSLLLRFGIAAFSALNIMMLSYPLYATYFNAASNNEGFLFAQISGLLAIPALTYSAWPIYRRFWAGLKVGLLGMETLVVIGIAAGLSVSLWELSHHSKHVYFDSMTVIIAFVLLGKVVEARAKFSSKDALIRLSRGLPRRGRKQMPDGSVQWIPIKEIRVGDVLSVAVGERVVLDGQVLEGQGSCDESLLTGEALPVPKEAGAAVVSGAVLKQGWLSYRVTRTQQQSALQQIVDMVQQDLGAKGEYTRLIDVITKAFIPTVALIALTSGLWAFLFPIVGHTPLSSGLLRAMSVLLISCPCAVGIAAPLAEARIINRMASWGILVRNRACLGRLAKVTCCLFDKTGTITEGKFQLLGGHVELSQPEQRWVKSTAQHSNHPISCAIASSLDVEPVEASQVREVAGRGVCALVEGQRVVIGSRRFLEELKIPCPDISSGEGELETKVQVAFETTWRTELILGDRLRPEVHSLLEDLTQMRVELISGDMTEAVESTARIAGIAHWLAAQSPLDKRTRVHTLQSEGQVVCMVGDGINDAPALTAADVGVAALSATDMSIQVSDILLTTGSLDKLPQLFVTATKGQRLIKQNLAWAFSYNIVGIGLAAYGVLNPLMAAIAMVCSSLIVLGNSLRMR